MFTVLYLSLNYTTEGVILTTCRRARAHTIVISATALLLTFGQLHSFKASDFTTAVSARVAPYLKRGSGYVRPEFRADVARDRIRILTIAKRYNIRSQTNMSDSQFATVMVTILYTEHNGWLEDEFPIIRPITPIYQNAQAFSNTWFGSNFSVWPSNLRPSVVREILSKSVPQVGTVVLPLAIPPVADLQLNAQQLANTPDSAYELLGANLRRGVYRAQHEGVIVTWQTLLAWHNAGIVNPTVMAKNPSLLHYLSRAVPYISPAQSLFRSIGMCQNTPPVAVTDRSAHATESHNNYAFTNAAPAMQVPRSPVAD